MFGSARFALAGFAVVALAGEVSAREKTGDDPFADELISFDPGVNPSSFYDDPLTALGAPERTSGEFFEILDVVSAFSPAYGPDEIISISPGGHLVVKFDTPVTNDPNNLYGIDLLIFGNASFADESYPNGIVSGYFGDDGGTIEISDDGINWFAVPALIADGPFPTMGYQDSGAYDHKPGTVLTDFTQPVDPSLSLKDFMGLVNEQVIEKYRGSGGGVGVDIGSAGIDVVQYVRISLSVVSFEPIEIDAFSDVAPRLPGDVNLNGVVDVDDLLELINAWGLTEPGGPPADFDNNGVIDVDDLLVVINNWS